MSQARSIREIKHKWQDQQTKARADFAERKNLKTGGGCKPEEGTYSGMILQVIGYESVTLTGITGGGDEQGGS